MSLLSRFLNLVLFSQYTSINTLVNNTHYGNNNTDTIDLMVSTEASIEYGTIHMYSSKLDGWFSFIDKILFITRAPQILTYHEVILVLALTM